MKYVISPENTVLSADTVNILVYLERDFDDIGFYTTTDGKIVQEKTKCNFTYSKSGNTLTVFNSVDKYSFIELKDVTYNIYWGDGSISGITIEQSITHTYQTPGEYEVALKLETPWTDNIKKTIQIGGTTEILNPFGALIINVPYSDVTMEQNYINELDAEGQDEEEEDVYVSGFTQSRVKELIKYGSKTLVEGLDVNGNGVHLSGITDTYTAYTIDNIFYTDFTDGLTFFNLNVGENPLEMLSELVTKEESMMGVVNDIDIQSDVFVERGKISVFEHNMRLCEIDSVGEVEVYGNKYFTVKKTT